MAKQIKFNYEGVDYTLEYTRNTVKEMERRGFVISELEKKPMTLLPDLFAGAFLKHHRFTKREVIDAIYDGITNRSDLISNLAEMYNEPLQALIDEPDKKKGNVDWTANF